MPELSGIKITHAGDYKQVDNIAVIVEPRKHELLVPVVKNAMTVLGDKWKIQIFHGTENAEFIRNSELRDEIISGKVFLSNLGVSDLKNPLYSTLLLSSVFWENVFGENILIFQTDSVLCGGSKLKVDDFLKYDYIGAPWRDMGTSCFIYKDGAGYKAISSDETSLEKLQLSGAQEIQSHQTKIGNGGLSIRKRSKTLNVLQKVHAEGVFLAEYEDRYYSCVAEDSRMGWQSADFETAKKFSAGEIPCDGAFGTHQPWSAMQKHELDQLGGWCVEYEEVLRPFYRNREKR